MQKKYDIIVPLIFGFIFIAGLSVMFYPTFSDWWNKNMVSHTVSNYKETVAEIDNSKSEQILEEAHDYNRKLAELDSPFLEFDKIKGYDDILNISGTGIMGYVSIPSINIELPIYHGTSDGVLRIASGHIQGSSLPVGGASTHTVISGHRGLASAKLFTNLDKVVEGDIFTINVLNEVLTYEVEKILIILPDEVDKLAIVPGDDKVTLMTCTPYGINSHRLLIRAHRIETIFDKKIKVSADALQVDRLTVIPAVFAVFLLFTVIYWSISSRNKHSIRIDKYKVRNLKLQDREKHGIGS